MKVVRVGIVGCGWFGRAHARVYREVSGVELIAVADLDEKRAKNLAEMYGAKSYRSTREMVEKENLDLVSVVVTPQQLARSASLIADAGTNLLVEKPVATKRDEWDELYSIVKRKGLIFIPGFIELFNPGYGALWRAVSHEELGEVLTMSSRRIGRSPKRELKWEVGVTLDLAIHELYVQTHLTETKPEVLSSLTSHAMREESEDLSLLVLQFGPRIIGMIESNWLTPIGVRSIRVTGSEGSARLDYMTQNLVVDLRGESRTKYVRWREPLLAELEYATEHIRRGEKPEIDEDFTGNVLHCSFEALERAREIPSLE